MSATSSMGGINTAFAFLHLVVTAGVLVTAPAVADDEYWIVQEDGASRWTSSGHVGSVEVHTPSLTGIRSAAVSSSDGSVWMFDGERMRGFDRDAMPLAEIAVDGMASGTPDGIHVDTAAGRIWMIGRGEVRAFSMTGVLLAAHDVPGSVVATAYDADAARLYVSNGNTLFIYGPGASAPADVELPKAVDVDALALSSDGTALLVAGRKTLSVLSLADGGFSAPVPHALHGRVLEGFMADNHGWLVGLHSLVKLSAEYGTSSVYPVFPSTSGSDGAEGIIKDAAAGEEGAVAIGDHTLALIGSNVTVHELAAITGRAGRGVAVLALDGKDVEPPVLEILDPAPGAQRPAFPTVLLYAEDERSDIDYAGAVVDNSAGCRYAFSPELSLLPQRAAYVCEAVSPEGPLTITASVPDVAGNFSVPVSVDVIVDSIPPRIDAAAIRITLNDDGTVTVSLPAGGAEPGARIFITVTHDGVEQHHELVVGDDGGFEVVLTAGPGDTLTIEAVDDAGNSSGETTLDVEEPAAFVIIDTPSASGTVHGREVDVLGRYKGPENVGITVNGIVARTGVNNTFFVEDVPLSEQGPVTLTARLSVVEGVIDTHEQAILVSHEDVSSVRIDALSATGKAPFATEFSIALAAEQADSLVVDLDGDGIFETTAAAGETLSHVYPEAGAYEVAARAVINGTVHVASTTIFVTGEEASTAAMQAAWEGFNLSLLAGDVESATHYITVDQRARYARALEVLVEDYAAIHDSILEVRLLEADGASGEYMVVRDIDGARHVFLVQFVRSIDGVWRITSI